MALAVVSSLTTVKGEAREGGFVLARDCEVGVRGAVVKTVIGRRGGPACREYSVFGCAN